MTALSEQEAINNAQDLILKHEAADGNDIVSKELSSVLTELRTIGFSNIADVFQTTPFGVRIQSPDQLPRAVSAAIKSVKIKRHVEGRGENAEEFEMMEIQFYDKLGALEKLMRYHGGYAKEKEQEGNAVMEAMKMMMGVTARKGLVSPKVDGHAESETYFETAADDMEKTEFPSPWDDL